MMDLHELKIWINGVQAGLVNANPTKIQWESIVKQIENAEDASTKDQTNPFEVVVAKK